MESREQYHLNCAVAKAKLDIALTANELAVLCDVPHQSVRRWLTDVDPDGISPVRWALAKALRAFPEERRRLVASRVADVETAEASR